jgi:hypothetical protein
MVRIAKQSDPKKLRDLKRRINDPAYLASAIQRIAQTLTNELYMGAEIRNGQKQQ